MPLAARSQELRLILAGVAFLLACVGWSLVAPRVSPLAKAAEAVRAGRTTSIELDDELTVDDLSHLSDLTSLKELSLPGARVTDAGLAHIANLTNLTALNIAAERLTD